MIILLYVVILLNIKKLICQESYSEEESDISGFTFIKENVGNKQNLKLEIVLKNGNKEIVSLKKRPSILSKNIKIDMCKNGACEYMSVKDSEEKCNYMGVLESDGNSYLSVVGCSDQYQDLVIFSKSIHGTSFRRNENTGKVSVVNKSFKTSNPIPSHKIHKTKLNTRSEKAQEKKKCCKIKSKTCKKKKNGKRKCHIKVSHIVCGIICTHRRAKKMFHVSRKVPASKDYMDSLNSTTVASNCCRKIKYICYQDESLGKKCKREEGKKICGKLCKNNTIPIDTATTADTITTSIITTTTMIVTTPMIATKSTVKTTTTPMTTTTPIKASKSTIKATTTATWVKKSIKEAKVDDLINIYNNQDMASHKKENNTAVKIPKNIYKTKTLEIAITIDPAVYNEVKNLLGDDKNEITKYILKEVQHTLLNTQTYFDHPSISSTGGFTIIINGVKILQDWNQEGYTKIASEIILREQLINWQDYIKEKNIGTDADEYYHDIAVLFSGLKYSEVLDNGFMGFACVSCICDINAGTVFTYYLGEDGHAYQGIGKLLAHEMGHIIGANHDRQIVKFTSVFPEGAMMPCGKGMLMEPSISMAAMEYSECSRKDIDRMVKEVSEGDKPSCLYN